jgi:deoxyribodipyrimidine photo-lyase
MNIVWFRRNLRLEDNLPLYRAIKANKPILPIFIFDTNILAHFPNRHDRRVNFIAAALFNMHQKLQSMGAKMNIFHGDPKILIPNLVAALKANDILVENIYADEDFEPSNTERDNNVAQQGNYQLNLICDHLLLRPGNVLNNQGQPFKVFTPFSKAFKEKLVSASIKPAEYSLHSAEFFNLPENTSNQIKVIKFNNVTEIVQNIGYHRVQDDLWKADDAQNRLDGFIKNKISNYKSARDFMDEDSTSQLSPFIRFGLISIRTCFIQGYDKPHSDMWINELLWREFYANILFHFPHTVDTEFISTYANKLPWRQDQKMLEVVENSQTGFPIIDAAMRQLTTDGWMHNRSRMIVASFVTKNLLLDWRLGEQLFAKYLMDYDLASNLGGWQWSASCGTDAQPYFRIFNPILQAQKFDPQAKYIKKYLPELASVDSPNIYDGDKISKLYPILNYPKPIVDYHASRELALKVFDPKNLYS